MPQHFTLTPAAGGAPLAIRVPTSWADVTLATYIGLHQAQAELSTLALLTGIEQATVECLAAEDVTYLCNALAFVMDHTPLTALQPAGDLAEVGAAPYGLFVLATQHVQGLGEEVPTIAAAPYLYALYRSHQIYGKVDDAKVEAMRLAVLGEPVPLVLADVAFFLNSYKRVASGTRPTPTMSSSPKKTSGKRGWRSWVSGLGRSSRSTPRPTASG